MWSAKVRFSKEAIPQDPTNNTIWQFIFYFSFTIFVWYLLCNSFSTAILWKCFTFVYNWQIWNVIDIFFTNFINLLFTYDRLFLQCNICVQIYSSIRYILQTHASKFFFYLRMYIIFYWYIPFIFYAACNYLQDNIIYIVWISTLIS